MFKFDVIGVILLYGNDVRIGFFVLDKFGFRGIIVDVVKW